MPPPSRDAKAVRKYLDAHAEPEAREVDGRPGGPWPSVVVIPARDESPAFLRAGVGGGRDAPGPLRIVVINATPDATPEVIAANTALAEAARERPDVWVIERSGEGRWFPRGRGVGLARKIGLDVALAAWASGRVASPWLRTTDADADVPTDVATWAEGSAPGAHFPFWHEPTRGDAKDPTMDRAIAAYEVWLRWHVAGLRWAGSPYAFPSIGSCIAARADAYAQVRGVPPDRTAGEDFHFLDKLAKLAAEPPLIDRPATTRIRLRARLSARVPFGTGPGVRARLDALRRGEPIRLRPWASYAALREVVIWLDRLGRLDDEPPLPAPSRWRGPLAQIGALAKVEAAHRGSVRGRGRRVRDAFDGLATVRFLHALDADGGEDHRPRDWTRAVSEADAAVAGLADALDPDDPHATALRLALERASGAAGSGPVTARQPARRGE